METPTKERLDEVAARIASIARHLSLIDQPHSYSLPSNRRMKRLAVRLSILTTGFVMLQSEVLKMNASNAYAA